METEEEAPAAWPWVYLGRLEESTSGGRLHAQVEVRCSLDKRIAESNDGGRRACFESMAAVAPPSRTRARLLYTPRLHSHCRAWAHTCRAAT